MKKTHLFIIDPIEKLNLKKDSSLMLAMTLKIQKEKVFFVFEEDFSFDNKNLALAVTPFTGNITNDFAIEGMKLLPKEVMKLNKNFIIHMRLDPPFDQRYLRVLWSLNLFQVKGITVVNSPVGVASFNEKIFAYSQKNSLQTWIGGNFESLFSFAKMLSQKLQFMIVKPLDLYQGYGVEKIDLHSNELAATLRRNLDEKKVLVAQPFVAAVAKGEIRALYFKGKELGSILKIPPQGKFLANIAQGADYHAIKLPASVKKECDRLARELMKLGVPWIAYDILDKKISEVNITCPGLLVEVSKAHKTNLAEKIAKDLKQF